MSSGSLQPYEWHSIASDVRVFIKNATGNSIANDAEIFAPCQIHGGPDERGRVEVTYRGFNGQEVKRKLDVSSFVIFLSSRWGYNREYCKCDEHIIIDDYYYRQLTFHNYEGGPTR